MFIEHLHNQSSRKTGITKMQSCRIQRAGTNQTEGKAYPLAGKHDSVETVKELPCNHIMSKRLWQWVWTRARLVRASLLQQTFAGTLNLSSSLSRFLGTLYLSILPHKSHLHFKCWALSTKVGAHWEHGWQSLGLWGQIAVDKWMKVGG